MNILTKAHPETHEILNNARAAVASGELTEEQGKETLDNILDVVIHLPYKKKLDPYLANRRTLSNECFGDNPAVMNGRNSVQSCPAMLCYRLSSCNRAEWRGLTKRASDWWVRCGYQCFVSSSAVTC